MAALRVGAVILQSTKLPGESRGVCPSGLMDFEKVRIKLRAVNSPCMKQNLTVMYILEVRMGNGYHLSKRETSLS